jgi:hypothetical protein
MTDKAQRRELLLAATEGANSDYVRNALYETEREGVSSAAVEYSVLFSWINQLIQPRHDTTWLEKRLAAIEYRGGPRNKADEAYLRLKEKSADIAALTEIIREKQLDVANGFFGIHSGAYSFEFKPIPRLRFTIHYGKSDEDFVVIEQKELPNAIDALFLSYVSDAN